MHDVVRNLRAKRNAIIERYNVNVDRMYILMHPRDIRLIGGTSWLQRFSKPTEHTDLRDIYLYGMKVVESVDIPEGKPTVVWWPDV